MQGVFVEGHRPRTKKELKEAVAKARDVVLEATSLFGNEYNGPVEAMPEHDPAYVVGPNPYNDRRWYATIKRAGGRVVVT